MAQLLLFNTNGTREAMPEGPSNGYARAQNPARGYKELSEQIVTTTRNANGQVIAEKRNRRMNKFDSLKWPYLSREQVTWLKQKIANFEVRLTYYDSEAGAVIYDRRFYFGDFSAEPVEWDRDGDIMIPTFYKDVSVNLIDMGY